MVSPVIQTPSTKNDEENGAVSAYCGLAMGKDRRGLWGARAAILHQCPDCGAIAGLPCAIADPRKLWHRSRLRAANQERAAAKKQRLDAAKSYYLFD